MMALSIGRIVLDTKRLDQIAANLDKNTQQAIKAIAFRVETYAKQLAPIETSALENSIYTVTLRHDGFSEASSKAKQKNPKANIVRLPNPPEKTAFVGPSVEYGIYQELGTYKMAAHPYLVPGAERAAKEVGTEFEKVLFK